MKAIKLTILLSSRKISLGYSQYLFAILSYFDHSNEFDEINILIDKRLLPVFINKKYRHISIKTIGPNFITKYFGIKKELNKNRPDILFIPVERFIPIKNVNIVSMIQNMEIFFNQHIDNTKKEKIVLFIKKIVSLYCLKKTKGVISISNFCLGYLVNNRIKDNESIALIYHGSKKTSEIQIPPKLSADFLNGGFIFSAGSIRPARGVEDLINAIGYLRSKINFSVNLIFAGSLDTADKSYLNSLYALIKEYELQNNIHFIGDIPQEQVYWYLKNSSVFVMTSKVEACSILAMEAIAVKKLSIISDSPSLPEIFNGGALKYKTSDYKDLARKIIEIFNLKEDKRLAYDTILSELQKKYSWEITGKQTIDFFKLIINSKA